MLHLQLQLQRSISISAAEAAAAAVSPPAASLDAVSPRLDEEGDDKEEGKIIVTQSVQLLGVVLRVCVLAFRTFNELVRLTPLSISFEVILYRCGFIGVI